jgi:hypothetical protein
VQIITRVQRELTKRIFMHESQRLLITFSAGVAVYQPGESQADCSSAPTSPCTRPRTPARTASSPIRAAADRPPA